MNVLMITPRVDKEDKAFGFVYYWILKLSEKVDKLIVLTIEKKDITLPNNVKVYSINTHNRFLEVSRFYKLSNEILKNENIDFIFPHMYTEFSLLIWPLAKIYRKPIVTWYAHSVVNLRIKLVNMLVNKIVTSTKEGCKIKTNKLVVIGQGVNTDYFKPLNKKKKEKILLTLGRIGKVKNLDDLIKAIKAIKNAKLLIVGDPVSEKDAIYLDELKKLVKDLELNNVEFHKGIPFSETLNYYNNAVIFLHGCNSGLDKASLEAMSCALPIITCSNSHKEILKEHQNCLFTEHHIDELAIKTKAILDMNDKARTKLGLELRQIVINNHSLDNLMNNLVSVFKDTIK